MTILISVIVFLSAIILVSVISFFNLINKLQNIFKQSCQEYSETIIRQENKIVLLLTSNLICQMLLCSSKNNYEQFTFYYHKLYFMGVKKDILDDPNKLTDFYMDCIADKFIIKNGERNFQYQYVKKEE